MVATFTNDCKEIMIVDSKGNPDATLTEFRIEYEDGRKTSFFATVSQMETLALFLKSTAQHKRSGG